MAGHLCGRAAARRHQNGRLQRSHEGLLRDPQSPTAATTEDQRCRPTCSGCDICPHGRRLDFLTQELNREANTLGAKSIMPETSQRAVDLKVIIEQIREQVQNIE